MLDFEEYLHLAIHASKNNSHHFALEYLHKALEILPQDPRANFLLAAEYAELGLYSRAISLMEKSLELDPKLEMAYYQLALLYIQIGKQQESAGMWQLLSKFENSSLSIFAQGMLLLEMDKKQGLALLNKAVSMPSDNPALQQNMEIVINSLLSTDPSDEEPEADSYSTLFLNAYKESTFNDDGR